MPIDPAPQEKSCRGFWGVNAKSTIELFCDRLEDEAAPELRLEFLGKRLVAAIAKGDKEREAEVRKELEKIQEKFEAL